MRIAALAEVHYVGVQPHAIHGPMETLAAFHVDAATPHCMIHEYSIAPWFQDASVGNFPVMQGSYSPIPTAPGLGVAINKQWVKAHPPLPDAGWAPPLGSIPSKQFSMVASP
jgi:galactonate dehydratase